MINCCEQCGERFEAVGRRGRSPRFCSAACKQRAYRARKARPFPELMLGRRWVRAVGKRPVMPDGSPARSNDPLTWSELGDVRQGAGDGFGVMLGGGLGCYDLDGAVESGRLLPWAVEFVASIAEPVVYSELSVSGTGVHVFVEAVESRGWRRDVGCGRVERYSCGRFIRCGEPLKL